MMIDRLITEIIHEFGMIAILNLYDLNSVITTKETIAFLNEGQLMRRGGKNKVLVSPNPFLDDCIYAQPLT